MDEVYRRRIELTKRSILTKSMRSRPKNHLGLLAKVVSAQTLIDRSGPTPHASRASYAGHNYGGQGTCMKRNCRGTTPSSPRKRQSRGARDLCFSAVAAPRLCRAGPSRSRLQALSTSSSSGAARHGTATRRCPRRCIQNRDFNHTICCVNETL